MSVKVRLFGVLADAAGVQELEFTGVTTVSGLRSGLSAVHLVFDQTSYLVAINRKVAKGDEPFSENDEIAILPPFSGG